MTVTHAWSGAAGPTSARVKAKVSGGSTRLAVSTDIALTSPLFFGPATPTADGMVDFTATGLANDTQYYYGFEIAGALDTSMVGRFHTHKPVGAPYSFTFAAWACAGSSPVFPASAGLAPQRISNHPGYDDIRAADPLFTIDMGDKTYYDFGSGRWVPDYTAATYRAMYDDVLATSRHGRLYRDIAHVYTWSNHDFGQLVPGDDTTSDGTHPGKANAAQVYRERVPSYPLVEVTGPIYHSFQVGRLLVVVTDSRYNRSNVNDPAPRTMYGPAQMAWLEDLLTTKADDPGVKALCWVSDQPSSSGGGASWGVFPEERDHIYGLFTDHGWVNRMFEIAGDQHQLGFDTGTHTAGFPLYTLASMDSNSGGAGGGYDIGTFVDNVNRGHYGLITIEDPGGTFLRWDARGYSYHA
ncbi:MAG: hypothetical protein J2P24_00340 [Streptosporangiales bacterium]|nr:hypothetical protein [Streptosporangiales bacterium]